MKKLLLALALLLAPSAAFAQCNGVFANNTVCGNVTGSTNLPRPTATTAFPTIPGGTNGQIQYNNSGALGGFTPGGDLSFANPNFTVNTFGTAQSGKVPASGGGTTNFLRADGSWAAPPAGTVTSVATGGLATGGTITTSGTVTVTSATKSDQQTGTSTTTAVTPAQQQQHDSGAKGWIYVTQSAGTYTTQKSYNMSMAKNSTGALTLTFATAFDSANYALICSPAATGSIIATTLITNSTTAAIDIRNLSATNVDSNFSCHAFGRQ